MKASSLATLAFAACCLALIPATSPADASPKPAKELFGAAEKGAALSPAAVGSYAKGCLGGGVQLPLDGPNWQGMRPSRNRHWGHPQLIKFLEKFSSDAKEKVNWPGLLVGDISQPRGGPMLTGHASHQIGLDADIWLDPAPKRRYTNEEREKLSATSVIASRSAINPNIWSTDHARLIRLAASYPQVGRVFVHPSIKKALCDWAGNDRAWLNKVRPIYGHNYHFHIRLKCPVGQDGCKEQAPPPPGDGCDASLAWWLSDKPYAKPDQPPKEPPKPPKPMLLSDLPPACTTILNAP